VKTCCKNWLQNLPPDFVRLLQWVNRHAIHIFEGFQQWSATISPKQILEIAFKMHLENEFIKGFNSDQLQFQQNRCYNITKCNLFIFENWLQNSPPDFVRLLQWVVDHAIHISKRFQQWSATISPKQMLEIATCLYAKIYFKIRRRTLSGCHSESCIMPYTFIKAFNSDQLQFQQNRCYIITKCNLFIFKNWLQNSPPDFVRLPQWVLHHAIHIYKGFQQWSTTISAKQMLQHNKMQLVYIQKLTSKFAAGLRPAATVSHTSCNTHL
jgi:hypothetical protein